MSQYDFRNWKKELDECREQIERLNYAFDRVVERLSRERKGMFNANGDQIGVYDSIRIGDAVKIVVEEVENAKSK